MSLPQHCPECQADWSSGLTCQEAFHQLLAWEQEDLARMGAAHHLLVLCYHLQHPSLYSPEGLKGASGLLKDFVAGGVTTQEVRRRDRETLDSSRREYKIRGTPEVHGSYPHPVDWGMTVMDVLAGGKEGFVERVRRWGEVVYSGLTRSGIS